MNHPGAVLQHQHDPADPSLQPRGMSHWQPSLEEQRPFTLPLLCCPQQLGWWGGVADSPEELPESTPLPMSGEEE